MTLNIWFVHSMNKVKSGRLVCQSISNVHVPRLYESDWGTVGMLCFVIDCCRMCQIYEWVNVYVCVCVSHSINKRFSLLSSFEQTWPCCAANRARKWKHCYPLYNPRLQWDNKNKNTSNKIHANKIQLLPILLSAFLKWCHECGCVSAHSLI